MGAVATCHVSQAPRCSHRLGQAKAACARPAAALCLRSSSANRSQEPPRTVSPGLCATAVPCRVPICVTTNPSAGSQARWVGGLKGCEPVAGPPSATQSKQPQRHLDGTLTLRPGHGADIVSPHPARRKVWAGLEVALHKPSSGPGFQGARCWVRGSGRGGCAQPGHNAQPRREAHCAADAWHRGTPLALTQNRLKRGRMKAIHVRASCRLGARCTIVMPAAAQGRGRVRRSKALLRCPAGAAGMRRDACARGRSLRSCRCAVKQSCKLNIIACAPTCQDKNTHPGRPSTGWRGQ